MFKSIQNIKVTKFRCKPSWSGTVSSNKVFHNSYTTCFSNSTNIIYKKVPLPLQGKDGTTFVENTDVMDLVDSVCSLKNHPQQIVKTVHSPYHLQMYDTLSRFCFHSQNLNFKGKCGAGSYCLQGPSGIGKTSTLINMTMIGEYLYPRVIPIYISYLNIQSNADLRAHSIFHMVVSVLKEMGHQVPIEEGKDLFPNILEYLDKSDKRVVLFVDEIDAMYTINHETDIDLARLANRNLSELATIGNDDSGLISAMLCSSSSHLNSLISSAARHSPELVLQFPLVKVSPNINTTKFSTVLINPPTNLEPIRKAINLKDMSLLRVAIMICIPILTNLFKWKY